MAKTAIQPMRSQPILGMRGRTPEVPVIQTVHVSGEAQTRIVDLDRPPRFDLSPHGRDRLPERPSTSGGNSTISFSPRRNHEKRETKDDFHLNPLAAHGIGTTFYDFPLPGSFPSAVATPRSLPSAALPVRNSSLAGSISSRSLESIEREAGVMDSQMNIGMALGSPSHPPVQPIETSWSQSQNSQQVQFDMARVASPEEMESPMDGWGDLSPPPKQKASKWKILGGLFGGRKNAVSQTPFYQVQPEGVQGQTMVESDFVNYGSPSASVNEKPAKPRGKLRTNSEWKISKSKPGMKRANTAPHNGSEFEFDSEQEHKRAGAPQIRLDGGPMLNVEIPSIHMERYSVMFGSVLRPNASSSSALLARRQATLEKLKTVNEALRQKERELEEKEERLLRPRRATSPQPAKSPAFSLFPNTPSRNTTRDLSPSEPRHRSPLQRSNTAPGALSPAKTSFEESIQPKDKPLLKAKPLTAPPIALPPPPPLQSQMKDGRNNTNGRPKHQPIVTQFSQDESHLDLTSPADSDFSYENDVYDSAPLPIKPKNASPAWETATHHHTAGAGSTSSGSTLNSASSAATSVSSALDSLAAPPSRLRAGTITHSTISTSSMEVPIAFAQPPTRERAATIPSKLKQSTAAEDVIAHFQPPPTHRNKNRANSPQRQTQMSHQKGSSSDGFSLASSVAEEALSEDEQRIRNAADVSIARQISVSRQQRQLLVPIRKPSSATPSPTNQQKTASPTPSDRRTATAESKIPLPTNTNRAGPSVISGPINLSGGQDTRPRPRINVKTEWNGLGERLGERLVDSPVKALTPTVVVVGGPARLKPNGQHVKKGSPIGPAVGLTVVDLQHRKSARGVVEHA